MTTDPIKCLACGYKDPDGNTSLPECPACGSEHLVYPVPSDDEIIDGLIIVPDPSGQFTGVQAGKETMDGRGNVIVAGDAVKLYARIDARVFKVIMPQGWLYVRLLGTRPDVLYQISSALVFKV